MQLNAARWLLISFISAYQRLVCGCVADDSCCRAGLAAARTLPFLAAVRFCWIRYGDCKESIP